MSCEDIPSLLDLQNTKKHIDDFGRLMGAGTGTSTNGVTGQVRPTYNAVMANLGYTRVGTFASGGTLTTWRQTLLWDIADGGDGQEYGWSGTFPPSGKVVPPGSTPLTTGGIAVGAWMSRFDPELRIQVRESLRRSYAEAGYNLVSGSFEVGGTLTDVNDVLLQESSGKAYSWAGEFPKLVAAGSDVAGYIDQSSSSLSGNLAAVGSTVIIGGVTAGDLVDKYNTPNPIDAGAGAGVFIESLLDEDAAVLHSMGVNYVVYLYHPSLIGVTKALSDIRELDKYSIGVVFSLYGVEDTSGITTLVNAVKNEPNILAWYLYDEPDGAGITVATQDAKIGLVNTLSGLPVAVSASSDFGTDRRLSRNFNYYFISRYISEADYIAKADAELDLFFMLNFRNIGADVGVKKCIPVLQAYEQGAVKVLSRDDMLRVWKKAAKYYQPCICFFLYSANATQPGGFPKMLANDSDLRDIAKTKIDINRKINLSPDICAKSMFIAQDGVVFSGDSKTLLDALHIFDVSKSSGAYGVHAFFPNTPSLAGYYPNYNGLTVIDLGIKADKLSIRFVGRNDRDANIVNVEIGALYTTVGGVVLKTITGVSNVTPVTSELYGINSRFIYIKLINPSFTSIHNGYLAVTGVQFVASI